MKHLQPPTIDDPLWAGEAPLRLAASHPYVVAVPEVRRSRLLVASPGGGWGGSETAGRSVTRPGRCSAEAEGDGGEPGGGEGEGEGERATGKDSKNRDVRKQRKVLMSRRGLLESVASTRLQVFLSARLPVWLLEVWTLLIS